MFTPLRHALSLAVGSALAVSASGALAGPDGSVFDKYNTQYFSGVGKAESPYDGTKDIQKWTSAEYAERDLRMIYLHTGLDPLNSKSSVNGSVHVSFSGLNLVNDKGSKPYRITMSDSNSDKSPVRDMGLTFANSVVKRWNIIVEEPTYQNKFGIEEGEPSTEHSIAFIDSEFTGDILHNAKEEGLLNNLNRLSGEGNQLVLELYGTKWTGATYSTTTRSTGGTGTKEERDETLEHSTKLFLFSNSHWAVTDDSFVTTLTADSDSDVEILAGTAEKKTKLSIGNLGSDVRVNVNDNTSLTVVGEQTTEPAAAVLVDGENTIHELDVRFKGLENAAVAVRADNVSTKLVASDTLRAEYDDNALISAMAKAVHTKENTVRFELEADTFSDAVSGTLGRQEDGTFQVDQMNRKTNENALAVADTGSILFMQWRAETDDVMQRMGDVRSSGKTGLWVRHYGGRSEFGSSDYDYLALQMGADRLVYDGDVKVLAGAAFSYTDGDAKYSTGTSDAKSYAFTAYGELLTQSGSFLTAALKYGALRNEVELSKTIDGEFRADAWAFSVETGHRFALAKSFFVEPHVGLTYAKVNGDSFRVGDNASVKQDDFDSLVGGVGLTLGFSCPNDRGDVYLRLDQKYDFQGETSTGFYSNGREVNRFDKDLGGSWFEIGLGAKARLTESLTGYAEFETAQSGEVETPFRWNLGLRYTF